MDIQWSTDDAWGLIIAAVGVLADAGEIPKERAQAILCLEHEGDEARRNRFSEALAAALNEGYRGLEAEEEAWLPGTKYMDMEDESPRCLAAERPEDDRCDVCGVESTWVGAEPDPSNIIHRRLLCEPHREAWGRFSGGFDRFVAEAREKKPA